jgi:hypothetical protein
MMRSEFNAVETSEKIATRMLSRRCMTSLIFPYARRAEFIVSSRQELEITPADHTAPTVLQARSLASGGW